MKIEKTPFGTTLQGQSVEQYTLTGEDICVQVLTYGATIRTLTVPDRTGKKVDVVLGYDTLKEYEQNDGYLGACIGRVGNRIGGGSFSLNGKSWHLACNDGANHLHGGLRGFDKQVWQAEPLADGLRLSRLSPDGEEGYPGNLQVSVSYRLIGRALQLDYSAASDQDTLCSLTNHTYFNLNGGGTVLTHLLQVDAESFLENDTGCLPTGRRLPVEGTPFDFRQAMPIGARIGQAHCQIESCGGYDHNFCLPGSADDHPVARLTSPDSGISMEMTTTMPGVQVYSGNFLTHRAGKQGKHYEKRDAICLETQYYPNAMACGDFEKPILRSGQTYCHSTRYRFSAE